MALLVSEEVSHCVKEWKEISSSFMWVKMKMGSETWVFVSAYGSGGERKEEEREELYRELTDCVERLERIGNVMALIHSRRGDWRLGCILCRATEVSYVKEYFLIFSEL